jgi:type III pantothenate kinase
MRLLCLDFGNTLLKGAVLDHGMIESRVQFSENDTAPLMNLLKNNPLDLCILSSVIHHDNKIETIISSHCPLHILSHNSKLNFSLNVEQPETIGADRLALMAGAVIKYPDKPRLIISMGTCITYSYVDSSGCFLGGAISPGVDMRFKSMHYYTSKLPETQLNNQVDITGKNTLTNLQSGVFHGLIGEINHFADIFHANSGDGVVILTGGNAPFFAERLKRRIFADPDLMFYGLQSLAQINA